MVKTLEKENFSKLARRHVVAALREVLSDPDAGLSLQPRMVSRLKKSVRSKEVGKVKNLETILAKHRV